MLLLLSGIPFSGKTTFLDLLLSKFEDKLSPYSRIDPKDYYICGLDGLSDDVRTSHAIAAWKVALEDVYTELTNKDNDWIIIFDTCAASSNPMLELIEYAKHNANHDVVTVFVAAHRNVCIDRSDFPSGGPKIINGYIGKFKYTLPKFKEMSDQFIIIKNYGDKEDINIQKAFDGIAGIKYGKSGIHKSS